MNKWLVSISAAAVAAGAMAAVNSANTVGFIGKEADADEYTPVAVMFADVGENTLAISSISFDGIARYDTLQIFGSDGNVATELMRTRSSWQDGDGEDASDWVFAPGDSFWITPASDVTATFPGQVQDEALTITATGDQYTPFGNGTPSPVAIGDIEFDGIARYDTLQIFGSDGNVATELMRTRSSWQDGDGEDASDWVFAPGDAFWISPAGDVVVTIPAAI